MITTNFELPVMSSWMPLNGRRLDCKPYLYGAFQAKFILDKLKAKKVPLQKLTRGGMKGIFNGPRFSRVYVMDYEYGVPLLSGTEMLQADLSKAPLISKKQVQAMPYMVLQEGTTLVSSYGTIGKTIFCRSEMTGMVGSDNVMKIIPDSRHILPGYLYAFLSCRFGLPILISGTSGSVITFLDPSRVADVPIPIAPIGVQERVDDLVNEAAQLRNQASDLRGKIIHLVESSLGWSHVKVDLQTNTAQSVSLQARLDAFHYSLKVQESLATLARYPDSQALYKLVEDVFEPNRMPRVKVDGEGLGIPFFSSSEVFRVNPTADYSISKKTKALNTFIISEKDLLIPRSGQIGGLIGRAVLPGRSIIGGAASEHLVRIRCFSKEDAAYFWALFASEPGYHAAIGTAYGSSIPSLDSTLIKEIKLPWFSNNERVQIQVKAMSMMDMLNTAILKEAEAIALIEQFIEQG